jgi:hypothetical protein
VRCRWRPERRDGGGNGTGHTEKAVPLSVDDGRARVNAVADGRNA